MDTHTYHDRLKGRALLQNGTWPTRPEIRVDSNTNQFHKDEHCPSKQYSTLQTTANTVDHPDHAEVGEALRLLSLFVQQSYVPGSSLHDHIQQSWSPASYALDNKERRDISAKRTFQVKKWLKSNKEGLNSRLRRNATNVNDHQLPLKQCMDTRGSLSHRLPSLARELDAAGQQIQELPTEAVELPADPLGPPPYDALTPTSPVRRSMYELVEAPETPLSSELDSYETDHSIQSTPDGGLDVRRTHTQSQDSVTRLKSTTHLLRKIREERKRLRHSTLGLSPEERDVKRAIDRLTAFANRQKDRETIIDLDFWGGFVEALQEDQTPAVNRHQSAVAGTAQSYGDRSSGCGKDDTTVGCQRESKRFICPRNARMQTSRSCSDAATAPIIADSPLRQNTFYNDNIPRSRIRRSNQRSLDEAITPSNGSRVHRPVYSEAVAAPVTPTAKEREKWQAPNSEIGSPASLSPELTSVAPYQADTGPRFAMCRSHSLPDLRSGIEIVHIQQSLLKVDKETPTPAGSPINSVVMEEEQTKSDSIADHIPVHGPNCVEREVQPHRDKAHDAVNAERTDGPQMGEFLLPQVTFGTLVLSSLVDSMLRGISLLHQLTGKSPIPDNHVRISWNCGCGEQLHDDFIERRAGAAHELQSQLRGIRMHSNNSSPTSESPHGSSAFSTPGNVSPSSSHTWTPNTSAGNSPCQQKPAQTLPSPVSTFSITVPERNPPYLLTCANEGRLTPKLTHLDMGTDRISNDKDLALALRTHYFGLNNQWYHYFRLRGLTMIDFVRFEYHKNRFTDVRKRPDMPEADNRDYTFTPDLIPPVGSNYLIHLLNHPQDYEDESVAYDRIPKRMGKLSPGECGWGIELVETFLADRVWGLVLGVFGLGSMVFGIVYGARKHDVQGAFGVAAWVCGSAVLLIGWLQACFG